jgi:hypothetical protein
MVEPSQLNTWGRGPSIAPLPQDDQNIEEVFPLLGEQVLMARGMLFVLPGLHYS